MSIEALRRSMKRGWLCVRKKKEYIRTKKCENKICGASVSLTEG